LKRGRPLLVAERHAAASAGLESRVEGTHVLPAWLLERHPL
jgi:hypothetical protein